MGPVWGHGFNGVTCISRAALGSPGRKQRSPGPAWASIRQQPGPGLHGDASSRDLPRSPAG